MGIKDGLEKGKTDEIESHGIEGTSSTKRVGNDSLLIAAILQEEAISMVGKGPVSLNDVLDKIMGRFDLLKGGTKTLN